MYSQSYISKESYQNTVEWVTLASIKIWQKELSVSIGKSINLAI